MDNVKRATEIIKLLESEYPNVRTALHYKNTFHLMISVMLSAQTTDKQVNKVTPTLFKRFKKPEDFAKANVQEIGKYINTVGLWKGKSKNIKKACEILVEKYNSKVPKTMVELVSLPGIGRKTANVILSQGFGINEGIAVDTHCYRVSQRLGFHNRKDRNKAEEEMMPIVPRKDWGKFSLLLVEHGRAICKAQKPACDKCVLNKACPSAFKFPHFKK